MKTICIAGAMSGTGKTTLAERILSRLKGWSACKVTTCLDHGSRGCPRGREEECGVCGSLKDGYEIMEEKGDPASRGKDTGRMLAAGARNVLWVKARPACLTAALGEVLERLRESEGIVFEGNHSLLAIDPDVAVMVMSPDGRMKRSARQVRDSVDFFVDDAVDDELLERIVRRVKGC